MSQCCGFVIGHPVFRIGEKGSEIILHKETYKECKHLEGNKTYRKHKDSESNSYPLKKSMWWAATLVNILR